MEPTTGSCKEPVQYLQAGAPAESGGGSRWRGSKVSRGGGRCASHRRSDLLSRVFESAATCGEGRTYKRVFGTNPPGPSRYRTASAISRASGSVASAGVSGGLSGPDDHFSAHATAVSFPQPKAHRAAPPRYDATGGFDRPASRADRRVSPQRPTVRPLLPSITLQGTVSGSKEAR